MAAIVHSILELTYSIYSVADQVKANKRRCQRLCERLRVLDAPLQKLATNPQRAAAEEPTLQCTLCVVTDANKLVRKYTAAKWYARLYGAALGGHQDEFCAINERLRHCVEALQIDIAVDLFDARDDVTDKQLDAQQMVNLLEQFVGEQDRTRDVVLEVKQLIKNLVQRDTPTTTLREIDPGELVEGALLGRGGFGEVRAGTWAGVSVAIKKLPPLLSVDAKTLEELRNEATTHQQLSHPNVLAFFGACISPPHRACLVVELAPGGSLYERIHLNQHIISPALALAFAIDIVAGLSHLHRRSIFHRDLKSPNVLIAVADVLKLADFGLARVKSANETLSSRRPASCKHIGTLAWMAPELHDDEDTTRPAWDKVDIYALGIIISELASGKIPWAGKKPTAIARAVLDKKRRPEISAEKRERHRVLVEFAEDCWAHNPADRLSVVDGGVQQRLVAALNGLGGDPRKGDTSSKSQRAHKNDDRSSADNGAAAATKMVKTPRLEDSSECEAFPAAVNATVVTDASIQDKGVKAQQDPEDPEDHHPEVGDIATLVEQLNTGTDETKEMTALLLATLTAKEWARTLILKAGGISQLIKLLKNGTDDAKTYAANALGNLSVGVDEAIEISKQGGIPALVEIAKSGTSDAKQYAVLGLHNFVVDPDWPAYRRLVVDAGGIAVLVDQANAGNETTQERAAIALYSLTDEANYRRCIAESGGINALENVLGTGTSRAKRVASRALSRLMPLKGSLFVGAKVEAKWKGGTSMFPGYYPGVITASNEDGTWAVKFDDGFCDGRIETGMIRIRKDGLSVGARVDAKWKGSADYYPGVIAGVNGDGTWDIQYDDGDRDGSVPADMIRLSNAALHVGADALCVGARVEAKWQRGTQYYPGVIAGRNVDGTWDVHYDDGDRDSSVPANMIRLSKAELHVGAKVKARLQGCSTYKPCVITCANVDGTWDVKFDNGHRGFRVATDFIQH